MNIFVTDNCPRKCAEYLDNKRVIKMVLETAQLLSTALHELGYGSDKIYKKTHVNHPCSVWARSDWRNYWWLYRHFLYLCAEYKKRYGKTHASAQLREALFPPKLVFAEPESFVNCARNKSIPGCDYTKAEDVRVAYQLYLNDRWDHDKREPSWESVV